MFLATVPKNPNPQSKNIPLAMEVKVLVVICGFSLNLGLQVTIPHYGDEDSLRTL